MTSRPPTLVPQRVFLPARGAEPTDQTVQRATLSRQQTVRLHVERLVLDGLPMSRHAGTVFQAALEAELGRLLAERGLPVSASFGGARPFADGGAFPLATKPNTRATAAQVAERVYAGLRS